METDCAATGWKGKRRHSHTTTNFLKRTMANFFPDAMPSVRQAGGLYRELEVLARVRESLPDDYDVFHSVGLHTLAGANDHYGEIDVLVMGPTGNILLMEVKAGDVILRNGDVFKLYGATEHDIGRQCRFQYGAIVSRLKEAGLHTSVLSCLVIPDYTIGDEHLVSIPRERIIDATGYAQLGSLVRELLSAGQGCYKIATLRQLLSNQFGVTADLSVLRDQLQTTVRTLSDGLATWVPRITAPSHVIRVQATAGSGKTQLALRLIVDAVEHGRSVGYVCYNRALADHIRTIAPAKAEISNFHELAVDSYRRHVCEPDFSDPSIFTTITHAYLARSAETAERFDVLIIDEGQDFEPEWIELLCGLLRPGGDLYLMDDDDQRLYERDGFDIDDAVTVSCRDNYRSPRAICDIINALGLASTSVRSMNGFRGDIPGFHVYGAKDASLQRKTEDAVASLLARGFALSDIVVLTCRGRARSELLGQRNIGPHRTRQFSGSYDQVGEAVWTDGELLIESVYRYKGQSAPAIVLTEVHFDELGAMDRKRLFVGMTRAQMALEIVLSDSAEKCMMASLGA